MEEKNNLFYRMQVGANFKMLRTNAGLNQSDIGSPALISCVEKGKNLPGAITIGRYVELFGLETVAKAMMWKYNKDT